MNRYDERFKAALTEDLKYTRKKGLGKIERASIPALAELAEALCPTPKDVPADDWDEVVEVALRRAVSRVRADERASPEDRRNAITDLFGLEDEETPGVMRRRDDTASRLGRASGEALRKAEGRLFSELAGHLLVLAEERDFWYWPLLSYSTFYPDRPVYDYRNPGDRAGATDGPVFNSFINTPGYGDERTFLDGCRSDRPLSTTYDPVRDVTDGSKVVALRIYVNNMAYVRRDDPYQSTAYGARVRVSLPTATASVLRVRGYILADNAEGVEDTVDLTGSEPFALTYMPGSAELLRPPHFAYPLSDSIVTEDGALVGHTVMDGVLPAGNQFEYAAFVTLKVSVVPLSHMPARSPRPKVWFTLHETEGYEIITV
jgi:hypothetical protein